MAYPFKKYNYAVLIDGFKQAGFSEVSAADVEVQHIEYREGNQKTMSLQMIPGMVKYSNVTLKWGASDSKEFSDWIAKTAGGDVTQKKVTIQLMDEKNSTVKAEWTLENAWPAKYTAPDFKASENGNAYESVELCHEGLSRTK